MSAKPHVFVVIADRFVERFGKKLLSPTIASLEGRRGSFNRLKRRFSSERRA
jgi:hypothetical protein